MELVGVFASACAGVATGVGALPVLFRSEYSRRAQDMMLGFGAGVMLAATSFSLIAPAKELLQAGERWRTAGTLAGGVLLGAVFLRLLHDHIPHEHFFKSRDVDEAQGRALARLWLFVLAITVHNFPEGLAVGVGYSGTEAGLGTAVALGIGAQNMPEGLVVAVALRAAGSTALRSVGLALLTGLVEPLGALVGVGAVALSQALLPWALTFAGGAMLYVVSQEVIPESHRAGHERAATGGLMVGFALGLVLDILLG